jgi:hypothetical protein
MDFIDEIERSLELAAQRKAGGIADHLRRHHAAGNPHWLPTRTPPPVDVTAFCDWYREYYQAS